MTKDETHIGMRVAVKDRLYTYGTMMGEVVTGTITARRVIHAFVQLDKVPLQASTRIRTPPRVPVLYEDLEPWN